MRTFDPEVFPSGSMLPWAWVSTTAVHRPFLCAPGVDLVGLFKMALERYWWEKTTRVKSPSEAKCLWFEEKVFRVISVLWAQKNFLYSLTPEFCLPRCKSNICNPLEMKSSRNRSPRVLLPRCHGSPVRQPVAHFYSSHPPVLSPTAQIEHLQPPWNEVEPE